MPRAHIVGVKTRRTNPVKDAAYTGFAKACLALPKAKQAEWVNGERLVGRISFRIDDTKFREFALWKLDEPQLGAHVRYNDVKRLDDPRFERSVAHRGTKHNWMYVKPESADWTALADILRESYEAAGQRGGGVLRSAELYEPLARGLALAAATDRPQRLHASGPAAKITANEGPCAFRLALWSTIEIRAFAARGERAAIDAAISALEAAGALRDRLVATLSGRELRMGKGCEQISRTADHLAEPEGSSEPFVAARATTTAYRCLPGGYNDRAVIAAGLAVEAAVRALQAAGKPGAVSAYLTELDRRVLIEEFRAIAAAHSIEPPAIERVLWRGADAKGFPAYWLAELSPGKQLALLAKLGARWKLVTGPRDHVMSTVPDSHFAAAMDWVAPELERW